MRPWVLLVLAACTPPRTPPRPNADPNGLPGCRSAATTLGGVRYACTSYEIVDNVVRAQSLRALADHLERAAHKQGIEATSGPYDIDGLEDAMLVEYSKRGQAAMDVLALKPLDLKVRVMQCHVPWFDPERSSARKALCKRAIEVLLQRPAPPGHDISEECERAARHMTKLSERIDHADAPEDPRTVVAKTLARCNDKLAACVLDATTYVEATLCMP